MKNKRKFDVSYETKTSEDIIKGYFEKIYLNEKETNNDLIDKVEEKIRPSNYPTTYKITEILI